MAFFKFRWPGRQQPAPDSAKPARRVASSPRSSQAAPSVEDMRRRARHRLIGAAVLVLAAVVGFPLLFDSQPRPVPVNVAIDIPDRDKVAPLVVPQEEPPARKAAEQPPASARDGAPASPAGGERPAPAPAERAASRPAGPAAAPEPPPAAAPKAEPPAQPRPDPRPEPHPEPKPEPKPEAKPEPKPEHKEPARAEPRPEPTAAHGDEASRARALLEGRAAATAPAPVRADAADGGRFVVQVGAFADIDKAREVQARLERSGLKAYTQNVDTKDGRRTRVRVGPFASRAEADKAAERVKGAGLAGAVLAL